MDDDGGDMRPGRPPDEPKPWEPVALIVLVLVVVIAIAVGCGSLAKWIVDEAVRVLRP